MTITATVIADSVSPAGIRLTTLQLRYPRFIHVEFMTHRVFSRNASSSRAIPVERLIQDVLDDPVYPSFWGKNRPGMQAAEGHNDWVQEPGQPDHFYGALTREQAWAIARDNAVAMARAFAKAGYHKQIVNRLLEPFSHINVVVTATEWDNFEKLRCHPDAQPEMRLLAEAMRDARAASTPALLQSVEWHLPYVDRERDVKAFKALRYMFESTHIPGSWSDLGLIQLSAARCARVSYLTHEGEAPSIEADLALYNRLVGAVPLHASPLEHQATPDELTPRGEAVRKDGDKMDEFCWKNSGQHGNFVGWRQHRKIIEAS